MSSKADDFDVRYRDSRDGRAWGSGANGDNADGDASDPGNDHGVLGGTVDYDLGYDANGWDTQGFRSPTAGYTDSHETGNGRGGSHARTSVTPPSVTPPPGAPTWAPGGPGATGSWLRPVLVV